MSKNLQKVQDMLDGNYKNKIQVGYSKGEKTRKVGEKWTDEDGIPWEQKNGYQVKGRLATSKNVHPSWEKKCCSCKKLITKPWDRDVYKADGRCYHCQIDFEAELKTGKPLRWFAYRRLKDLRNMKAIEKEMEQWIDELQKQKNKKVFDTKVANALANGEVEMSIKKNKLL
jgi:hypothetical protein